MKVLVPWFISVGLLVLAGISTAGYLLKQPPVTPQVLEFRPHPTVGDLLMAWGPVPPVETSTRRIGNTPATCLFYTNRKSWAALVCYMNAARPKGIGVPQLAG